MKTSVGTRTPQQVLDAADKIEQQLGEIAEGKRKPAKIDFRYWCTEEEFDAEIVKLIQEEL